MDSEFFYRRPQHAPPTSAAERDLSWKCGVCGYHVLAMDQSGKGLPLELGPSGQVLPLACPRCRQEHTHWTPTSPFDSFGDHANLPSALSSRVTHGASIFEAIHQFHNQQQSQQARAEELRSGSGASKTPLSGGGRDSSHGSRSGTPSAMLGMSMLSVKSGSMQFNAAKAEHDQLLLRQQLVTPTALMSQQQQTASALEYEMLSEHDALKDPDVVEALQRLRRRHGPNQQGDTSFLLGGGGGTPNAQPPLLGAATSSEDKLTDAQVARLPESSLQRAAAHRSTAPRALETYVCGLCGRRLLRIDHEGKLIPLEVDAQGNLTTIECPGCHQVHSQWVRTQLSGTASSHGSNKY